MSEVQARRRRKKRSHLSEYLSEGFFLLLRGLVGFGLAAIFWIGGNIVMAGVFHEPHDSAFLHWMIIGGIIVIAIALIVWWWEEFCWAIGRVR